MKKLLIAFISLFIFFACANKTETETEIENNTSEETSIENVNLEDELGDLETELDEIEGDSLKNED